VVSSSRASASKNAAIAQLANAARDRGEDFTGQEGLLKSTSATLLEAALEEEITGRLGARGWRGETSATGPNPRRS
jgi:putative transposase